MSKSERMRELFAEGRSVSDVAKLVGVDYAFAYGVAKRGGYLERRAPGRRDGPEHPVSTGHAGDHAALPHKSAAWNTIDVEGNLARYLEARRPTLRYASFDYCFNYFQAKRQNGQLQDLYDPPQRQVACLQLGFYLASWGMYRGSTVLLQRSLAHLIPVIDVVARSPREAWDIDANCYTPDRCSQLLELAAQIRAGLGSGATDTLVTKIMLGVFGSVPAFDTYFRAGSGVQAFGRSALMRLGYFYEAHRDVIERHRVSTLAFDTGADSDVSYTRAKVIDMVFFVEGARG